MLRFPFELGLVALFACSSNDPPLAALDTADICMRCESSAQAQNSCMINLAGLLSPKSCADQVTGASCDQDPLKVLVQCSTRCDSSQISGYSTCTDSHTLTICKPYVTQDSSGKEYLAFHYEEVIDCPTRCAAEGLSSKGCDTSTSADACNCSK